MKTINGGQGWGGGFKNREFQEALCQREQVSKERYQPEQGSHSHLRKGSVVGRIKKGAVGDFE